ncbi:hypothetical protein DENSPDRAFT_489778 [Dentipellis sp. KUC8613]|nr:hypothetical protein DENSPDRAFT_489778 [Dentipellis sp. KUC8613]
MLSCSCGRARWSPLWSCSIVGVGMLAVRMWIRQTHCRRDAGLDTHMPPSLSSEPRIICMSMPCYASRTPASLHYVASSAVFDELYIPCGSGSGGGGIRNRTRARRRGTGGELEGHGHGHWHQRARGRPHRLKAKMIALIGSGTRDICIRRTGFAAYSLQPPDAVVVIRIAPCYPWRTILISRGRAFTRYPPHLPAAYYARGSVLISLPCTAAGRPVALALALTMT